MEFRGKVVSIHAWLFIAGLLSDHIADVGKMGIKNTPVLVPEECDIIWLYVVDYIVLGHCTSSVKPSLLAAGAVFTYNSVHLLRIDIYSPKKYLCFGFFLACYIQFFINKSMSVANLWRFPFSYCVRYFWHSWTICFSLLSITPLIRVADVFPL